MLIIVSLILLFVKTWTYSIVDIDADNYKQKLHTNNETVWETGIEDYIPKLDAECLSIRTKEIYRKGSLYGVRIKRNPSKDDVNGFWYEFNGSPSNLLYSAIFKNDEIITRMDIHSNYDSSGGRKINEIAQQLIERNGFLLSKSKLILGSDIIIKETEEGFIIGSFGLKYGIPDEFPVVLYFITYSKKHFF